MNDAAAEEWYGVRCLFDHGPSEMIAGTRMYEERIVLVRGASFTAAIAKAEHNAEQYAQALVGVEYIGCAQAYLIADDLFEEGAEVFSLMRSSPLGADDYTARYFSTGTEHQGDVCDDSA